FADDDAGPVVDEHAAPYPRRRMYVHGKDFIDPTLEKACDADAAHRPQRVRHAIALQTLEPLVVEERNQRGLTSGIACEHGIQIVEARRDDFRVAPDRVAG